MNEVNDKKINAIKNSDAYKDNQMQIECIRKTMITNLDVPEQLVDWLITAVENNTKLLYQ